jgi:hypothetical protein
MLFELVSKLQEILSFNKILVTVEDFSELVPLPRKEQPPKEGIDKSKVARYLNACKNIQLKTALHVMASNGPRPLPVLSSNQLTLTI